MKELEDRILKDGKILPGDILSVGNFLNQQIDTDFLMKVGSEIADLFKDDGVTKVITLESSGIAIAFAAAYKLSVPMVFAKKRQSLNLSQDVYKANVFSYTNKAMYQILVGREFLSKDDKVLIVDDFLAKGNSARGLIDIVEMAGAGVAGVSCMVEKRFQEGGDQIRKSGIRVESLAIIESMEDGKIVFAKQ